VFPVATVDPTILLIHLWESLKRAAPDHWSGQGNIEQVEGVYEVTLLLAGKINRAAWAHASKFIRGYAKHCGWRVRNLKKKGQWVHFTLEKAD